MTVATRTPERARSPRRMGRSRALMAMARPTHIALILVILANGMLLGYTRAPVTVEAATVVSALILTVLVAAAVHLVNEAADHETDRLTERTPFSGGSGALEASGLAPLVPHRLGLALAAAAAVGGLASWALGLLPSVAVALLLAGLAGGLVYSLPPVAAMRHGWGEPLNALLGALLLPLFGVAAVSATVGPTEVVAFVPFWCVTMASVMATAWPDREADAVTGKTTMQVRLAPPRLRLVHALASGGFVVATVVSAAVDAMPLALAGLAVVPALVLGMIFYTRRPLPLPNVAAMAGLALLTTITLVLEVGG